MRSCDRSRLDSLRCAFGVLFVIVAVVVVVIVISRNDEVVCGGAAFLGSGGVPYAIHGAEGGADDLLLSQERPFGGKGGTL